MQETVDYALLVFPTLTQRARIQVEVEALRIRGAHVLDFRVDGERWSSMMHSDDLNLGPSFLYGWYRVHYTLINDDLNVKLCLCESHESCKSWELGFYMDRVLHEYCHAWKTQGSFPSLQAIKDAVWTRVEIVKNAREQVVGTSLVLRQRARDVASNRWNIIIDEHAAIARRFYRIALADKLVRDVGMQCKDAFMSADELDTSRLAQAMKATTRVMARVHEECEKRQGAAWTQQDVCDFCFRALAENRGEPWLFLSGIPASGGVHGTSKVVRRLLELAQEKRKRLFFMSLAYRMIRWRWRAVRGQNHPNVLKQRGVFDSIFPSLGLTT